MVLGDGRGRRNEWLPERGAGSRPSSGWPSGPGATITRGWSAEAAPYPYADPDELLAGDRPLLVALDEVTDPHNLGAVARVAECAGADGLLTTRRRSAAVTAAVCRASAGAVEHLPVAQVENLADTLIRSRRPGPVELRGGGGGRAAVRPARLSRRDAVRDGVGGPRACARGCDRRATRRSRSRWRGRIESLNVSTAAAVLLFEAVRQRRG